MGRGRWEESGRALRRQCLQRLNIDCCQLPANSDHRPAHLSRLLPRALSRELSQVLLTRFVKRIATDKVVIAFATLLVLAIVGIIVYAALNPGQQFFKVCVHKLALCGRS